MIVMKFGGSSLESAIAIEQVALNRESPFEQRPTVVVSAMGKTTDGLVAAADHAAQGNSYLAWRQLGEIREFHFRKPTASPRPGADASSIRTSCRNFAS